MTELIQSWESRLSLQQREFIQSFLADDAHRYQRLVAPPGSGKTAIATLITREFVQGKGAKKILYLISRRILVENYRAALKQLDLELPVEYVDFRKFRELLSNVSLDASPWPKEILVLMTIDTAKSPEVLDTILNTEWDLIVSDSIHYQGNRSKVLDLLLEKKNIRRWLIFDDEGQALKKVEAEYRSQGIVTTRWTFDIKQFAGSTGVSLQLSVIDYERSHEEGEFIRSYINLSEQTKNRFVQQNIRLRLASSSLYAAEKSLRRVRNKIAHQSTLSFLDEGDAVESKEDQAEFEISMIRPDGKMGHDLSQILTEIEHSLDILNRVPTDSKFDAFMSYVNYECKGDHVLVQSSYSDTISYLSSGLSEERDDLYQIRGLFSSEKIGFTLDRFRNKGGVLIASTTALAGADLELDELIFYDTLNNPTLIRQSIARLFRHFGSDNQSKSPIQKRIIAFRDKTKVIFSEERRLQQLQRIVGQLSQE